MPISTWCVDGIYDNLASRLPAFRGYLIKNTKFSWVIKHLYTAFINVIYFSILLFVSYHINSGGS